MPLRRMAEYPNFSDISDDELIRATQEGEQYVLFDESDVQDIDIVEATQVVEVLLSNDLPTIGGDDEMPALSSSNQTQEERFANVSDAEIEKRIQSGVPQNTRRRNNWAVNTWRKWGIARNNRRLYDHENKDVKTNNYNKMLTSLEKMDTDMLNYWIAKFIVEVRKENGEEYPPNTLLSLVMGLQSHLRIEANKSINLLESADFLHARQVLDAEMKRLTAKGTGIYTKKAEAFTDDEIEKLWNTKQLGDFSPNVLVRTMLFMNGINFGLRGGQEHRHLRYRSAQITLHEPADKTPYLQYTEDASKTVQGGLKHRRVEKKSVVHHANRRCPERCHVRLFKKYMELSPTTDRDNAFYLQPLKNMKPTLWYSRQAYGVNSLSRFVKEMCEKAGISGHHTNHSLRATTATKLFQEGVDEQLIMSRTGHRSVAGIRSYKRISGEQNEALSEILNGAEGSEVHKSTPAAAASSKSN